MKRKNGQELYLPCPKLDMLLRTQAYIYKMQESDCRRRENRAVSTKYGGAAASQMKLKPKDQEEVARVS